MDGRLPDGTQQRPTDQAPLTRRCRRGYRRLPATRTPTQYQPAIIFAEPSAFSRLSRIKLHCRHRPVCHRARWRPCAYKRSPSVSTRVCYPDAPARRLAERDRRATGASKYRGYEDLRKGRHRSIAHPRIALARRCGMNTLREAVQDYLSMRRSLGFKLREDGLRLLDFVA